MQDERLWIINFFRTYRPTEDTFQNVLDFFYFSSFLVPLLEYFRLNHPPSPVTLKKTPNKTLKKSKSHLILNFTALSENLEIRYCNRLANLYLKTFHRLWDYQQQLLYQLAYWIFQQEFSVSCTYWTTPLHPPPL